MKSTSSLALGAERVGLLVLKGPRAFLAGVAILLAIAVAGAVQINTDDALTDLLRSDTREYRAYELYRKLFPTEELDTYVVVEFPTPLTPERLEALREFHFDIGLADGVSDVLSMFSVHGRPSGGEDLTPVIDEELPEGAAFQDLLKILKTDTRFSGRFYAEPSDGQGLAVYITALDQQAASSQGEEALIAALHTEASGIAERLGLKIGMTGSPVMKAEILGAAKRDSKIFNIVGFALGVFLCFLFFQRWQYVVILQIPTLLSVACALGLIGWLGIPLNPLMNTIIPLVMVISFANALHLVFAIRRQIKRKDTVHEAIEYAVIRVGPACILSALTTAIAFASLALTDSHLIKVFGLVAAAATSISLVLVTTCVPALCAIILTKPSKVKARIKLPQVADRLDVFCSNLSAALAQNYRVVSATALAFVIIWTTAYVQLQPRYRISDITPVRGLASEFSPILDQNFGGLNVLHVMIRAKHKITDRPDEVESIMHAVETVLRSDPRLANVRSYTEIVDNLRTKDETRSLAQLLDELPPNLANRYVSADRTATVISANARDLEAYHMNRLRKYLKKRFRILRRQYADYDIQITGLAPLSAKRAINTINALNQALLSAVIIVLVLMGVLFRSLQVAILSFCANLFAVVATGFCLFLFDIGLQYVSVVALTVAFGLAVDDTVHFLNRYWMERNEGASPVKAVRSAVERVGPVLVLTTVVIVAGLAATLTSDVPPTRTFGAIAMATLVFALIGDVIVLPGAILTYQRLLPARFGGTPAADSPEQNTRG
ncbi:MAG: efflux RND transporter permease subunit [Pseudomonadota bacterium]